MPPDPSTPPKADPETIRQYKEAELTYLQALEQIQRVLKALGVEPAVEIHRLRPSVTARDVT